MVALVGAILFGGIGTLAFQSAKDATWDRDAPDVLCLESARSWWPSAACGSGGARWESRLAAGIAASHAESSRLEESAADARARAAEATAPDARSPLLEAANTLDDRASALRSSAERVEREAGVTPAHWSRDLLALVILPLMAVGALVLVVALALALVLIAQRARAATPGSVISDSLRRLRAWFPLLLVVVLTVVGAALVTSYWLWQPFALPTAAEGLEPGAASRFKDSVGAGSTVRTTWRPTCASTAMARPPRAGSARGSSIATARCCGTSRTTTTSWSSRPTARARC